MMENGKPRQPAGHAPTRPDSPCPSRTTARPSHTDWPEVRSPPLIEQIPSIARHDPLQRIIRHNRGHLDGHDPQLAQIRKRQREASTEPGRLCAVTQRAKSR